jgi:hypothetical protein
MNWLIRRSMINSCEPLAMPIKFMLEQLHRIRMLLLIENHDVVDGHVLLERLMLRHRW